MWYNLVEFTVIRISNLFEGEGVVMENKRMGEILKNDITTNINNYIFNIGYFILTWITITLIMTLLLFIIGVEISFFHLPLSIILSMVTFIFIKEKLGNKHNKKITYIILFAVFIAILAGSIYISYTRYDVTWDGRAYQQKAVIKLSEGWNPIYEYNKSMSVNYDLWVNHYAKAVWIVSTVIYKFTGLIETGKAFNILLSIAVFCIVYSIFNSKFKKGIIFNFIISFILALNPISIVQDFSYYNDGAVGSCIIIILVILMAINHKSSRDLEDAKDKGSIHDLWGVLFCTIVIVVNIKASGLFFSWVICAVYFAYWIFRDGIFKKGKGFNALKEIFIFFVIVYCIAFLIVGFNPYVTSYISKANFFYPLMGEGKVDIITPNQPDIFDDMSSYEKVYISLSSKSQDLMGEGTTTPKLPYEFFEEELKAFRGPAPRIGGFGPYFTLVLIMSIAPLLYFFIRGNKKLKIELIILLTSIILTVLVFPESWWARYVPHFYTIPIFIILFAYHCDRLPIYFNIGKIISIVIILILLNNMSLISGANLKYNDEVGGSIESSLMEIKKIDRKIRVYFDKSPFIYSQRIKLKEAGIEYEESEDKLENGKLLLYKMEYEFVENQ